MAIAGPAANFSLAVLAAILIHIGIWIRLFDHPDQTGFMHVVAVVTPGAAGGAASFLSLMFTLNLLLGTFNLLPVPPLDGFGAAGLLLPETTAAKFQSLGRSMRGFTYLGLLVAWRIFDPLFAPVFSLALKLLYPGLDYS